jgi:hypothetical protein
MILAFRSSLDTGNVGTSMAPNKDALDDAGSPAIAALRSQARRPVRA